MKRDLVWAFLFLLFFPFFALGAAFVYYAKDLPRPENFNELAFAQATRIYDRTGEVLLYEVFAQERRDPISLEEVPLHARNAIIAVEDANFYSHVGVDPRGIARAVLTNFKLRSPSQGGSTISQQLIRSSFLSQEKTLERKVREIVLALELERKYSKDEILEFYLNQVPWGSNVYGISAASRLYFQKHPSQLSIAESALLAAMIRAPSYYSPYGLHTEELMARKDYVLRRMESLGFIDEATATLAKQEQLVFAKTSESLQAPHFTLWVLDYLLQKYGEDFVRQNGLRVTIGPKDDPEAEHTVPVRAFHVHEVRALRERFDVVFVTCKSYDTRWLVQLIDVGCGTGLGAALSRRARREGFRSLDEPQVWTRGRQRVGDRAIRVA